MLKLSIFVLGFSADACDLKQMAGVQDPNLFIELSLSQCTGSAIARVSETILAVHHNRALINSDYLGSQLTGIRLLETLESLEGYVQVRLLRILSLMTRPVLSRITKSGCQNSHRYKASTISSLEANYTDFFSVASFFPIASRIRDISISRARCPEDTLISFMSVSRSILQVDLSTETRKSLFTEIGRSSLQIGLVRLLSVQQPVLDVLESLLLIVHNPHVEELVYVHGRLQRESVVFGFDCGDTNTCEVANVVTSLKSFNGTDIDKELRNEFMFIQSINSNWFSYLRNKGWGQRLVEALQSLKGQQERLDYHCEVATFVREYISNSSQFSVGEVVAFGMQLLANVDTKCTVAIATAFSLIQDGLIRALLSKHTSEKFKSEVLSLDAGMLMEMAWQTIAGDRLSDLVSSDIPLFELMNTTWLRFTT